MITSIADFFFEIRNVFGAGGTLSLSRARLAEGIKLGAGWALIVVEVETIIDTSGADSVRLAFTAVLDSTAAKHTGAQRFINEVAFVDATNTAFSSQTVEAVLVKNRAMNTLALFWVGSVPDARGAVVSGKAGSAVLVEAGAGEAVLVF